MKVITILTIIGFAAASSSSHSGFEGVVDPVLEGVATPLLTGAGRAVAGAAAGTQQTADLIGDTADTFLHTIGGIGANLEQGFGTALANVAPAIEDTIHGIKENGGPFGGFFRRMFDGN